MERNHILGNLGFGSWVLLRHLLLVNFRKLAKFCYKFGRRLSLQLPSKKLTSLPARLDWDYCAYVFWVSRFLFFFFLKRMNSNTTVHAHGFIVQETKCTVHRTYDYFIPKKKILKMGPTTLFTYLKIILLQCFQFSVFSKISCIRTKPTYFEHLTIDYMFFMFLAHMSVFVIIRYYLLFDT